MFEDQSLGYEDINSSIYNDKISLSKIHFTENELQCIESFSNDIYVRVYTFGIGQQYILIATRIEGDKLFEVVKCDDEWYYLEFFYNYKYYKCDQLNGLLQCIKDNMNIMNNNFGL